MRHLKKKVTLDRKKGARKSLITNLAESLILHERIKTTPAKARAVKSFVEKLITTAKKNNLSARRELIKKLYTRNAVKKLMEVIAPRYIDKKGGYTRMVLTTKTRVGDGADQAVIELIK